MIRVFHQYVSPKTIVLMLAECMLAGLALVCGIMIRFWGSGSDFTAYINLPDFTFQAIVFVAVLQVCFYYCDLYNFSTVHRARNELMMAVSQSLGASCLLLGSLYFIFPSLLLGRGVFFISIALVPGFMAVSRVGLSRLWKAAAPGETVAVIGTRHLAQVVITELSRRDDLNVAVAGLISVYGETAPQTVMGAPVLGSGKELLDVVERHGIGRIIVALEDSRNALPVRDLVRLKVQGVLVEDAHSTISALTGRVWLETVKPSWFVFSSGFHRSALTLVAKRAIDLACGMVGLIISLPAMVLVAVAIRMDSHGPVLYRQTRVGLRGKCFELLKFRSMRTDAESAGAQWASTNDPRVTRVGRLLRKYRLDELPQFVNVIRGEMSLVGPRPERPVFVEELRKKISYYDERHSVRPGVTGWAQVQYRYGSTVEDAVRKLEYDLFYLKNMSIFFDAAIIFQTIRTVVTGRGSE